jgi:hypothetical protein
MIALAKIGSVVWNFLKGLPNWALWLAAGFIFLKFVDMKAEMRGRSEQKKKSTEETRKNLDKIEDKSDARIEQADAIRAANPVSGDGDRVSDQPLPDYHYRD